MKGGRLFRTKGIKEGGERVTNVTRIIIELDDDLTVSVSSVQALLNIYFLPIYESASISKKAIWLQCKILKLRMISSTYFCHYNSGNFSLIPQILQKTATFLESQLLEIIKRATII